MNLKPFAREPQRSEFEQGRQNSLRHLRVGKPSKRNVAKDVLRVIALLRFKFGAFILQHDQSEPHYRVAKSRNGAPPKAHCAYSHVLAGVATNHGCSFTAILGMRAFDE